MRRISHQSEEGQTEDPRADSLADQLSISRRCPLPVSTACEGGAGRLDRNHRSSTVLVRLLPFFTRECHGHLPLPGYDPGLEPPRHPELPIQRESLPAGSRPVPSRRYLGSKGRLLQRRPDVLTQ